MKLVLAAILFFTFGLKNQQAQAPEGFKISTFKNVPDEMVGCGDCCYLSAKDKKDTTFICITNYDRALIYINNKPILLKANNTVKCTADEEAYKAGRYVLILKKTREKKEGDEYYIFKGMITVQVSGKVIFQQKITGDGGC